MAISRPSTSAFTLIEALLVIAIISLLASVTLASLQESRADARDAKKLQEVESVKQALELYRNDHGGYPTLDGSGDVVLSGGTAAEPIIARESDANGHYEKLMGELKNEGYLAEVPRSRNDGYVYINFNDGSRPRFYADLENPQQRRFAENALMRMNSHGTEFLINKNDESLGYHARTVPGSDDSGEYYEDVQLDGPPSSPDGYVHGIFFDATKEVHWTYAGGECTRIRPTPEKTFPDRRCTQRKKALKELMLNLHQMHQQVKDDPNRTACPMATGYCTFLCNGVLCTN